ncbi:MAG: DeoR/GlpR family transcriptional regulator [Gammaproteobacteria bacterium]|nr:DeoR/GlpR family transcriptional regulator [Gammaproteobacteria bacterium]
MNQTERHQAIVELVNERGFVTIEALARHFDVTPQTIRRDINQLDEENRVRRYHGGAGAPTSTSNIAYADRKIRNLEEKLRIADAVAQRIPDHSSLFINIGTTTETIARALLQHQGLTVITNNLHVASILSSKDDFNVIIAGGAVRNRDGGIIGEATVDFVRQFKVDFAVIGISGIDEDGDLLDFDYQEVRVAQAIIENSRQIFLAADHTKFGRNAMIRLGSIGQATHLFTDRQPPESVVAVMREHGVKLIIAPVDADPNAHPE